MEPNTTMAAWMGCGAAAIVTVAVATETGWPSWAATGPGRASGSVSCSRDRGTAVFSRRPAFAASSLSRAARSLMRTPVWTD